MMNPIDFPHAKIMRELELARLVVRELETELADYEREHCADVKREIAELETELNEPRGERL